MFFFVSHYVTSIPTRDNRKKKVQEWKTKAGPAPATVALYKDWLFSWVARRRMHEGLLKQNQRRDSSKEKQSERKSASKQGCLCVIISPILYVWKLLCFFEAPFTGLYYALIAYIKEKEVHWRDQASQTPVRDLSTEVCTVRIMIFSLQWGIVLFTSLDLRTYMAWLDWKF